MLTTRLKYELNTVVVYRENIMYIKRLKSGKSLNMLIAHAMLYRPVVVHSGSVSLSYTIFHQEFCWKSFLLEVPCMQIYKFTVTLTLSEFNSII